MRPALSVCCTAVFTALLSSTATSQSIRVDTVATIRESNGVHPSLHSTAARDSLGRYLVAVEPGPAVAIYDSSGAFVRLLEWSTTRADRSSRGIVPYRSGRLLFVFDGTAVRHYTNEGLREPADTNLATIIPGGHMFAGNGRAWAVLFDAPVDTLHALQVHSANYANPVAGQVHAPQDGEILDRIVSSPSCRDCPDAVQVDASYAVGKAYELRAIADQYRIQLLANWGSTRQLTATINSAWLPTGPPEAYPPGRTMPEVPRLTALKVRECLPRVWAGDNSCRPMVWVAGLVMNDSTASDEDTRYATVIDVFDGLTTAMRLTLVGQVRLPGRVDLIGDGWAVSREQESAGSWVLRVLRLNPPRQ